MKRRKHCSSPEETLYSAIRERMDLPLDYGRIRDRVADIGTDPAPAARPLPVRRRWAPTLAAVAATLAVVCGLTASGLWIADRLREPRPEPPLTTESEPTATEPAASETVPSPDSTPETPPAPETPSPETVPPESETVDPELYAQAPAEVTIGGVTYRKTKTSLPETAVGDAVGGTQGEGKHQPDLACHSLVYEDPRGGVAVRWGDTYILYTVSLSETES